MPDEQDQNGLLPNNEKLTREIFEQIRHALAQLTQCVVRAADYAEMIGLPDAETTKQLSQTITQLLTAIQEATRKMPDRNNRDKAPPTAQSPSSATSHQNAPDRTKPHLQLAPPTTHEIQDKDHS